MYSTWMQTEWNHNWTEYKDISITYLFLLEQLKNYQGGKNLTRKLWRGPTTWTDMLKTCVERYFEVANKKVEQLYKVSIFSWKIINSSRKKSNQLENYQKFAHKIVLKCQHLARIGRPDIQWSVNKLARSVTWWTQPSYIHHTNDFRQYCHVRNTAQHCRLGLFQDSDFAGHLEDSKSTSGGVLCIFGSITFVPVSWVCKKQTSVFDSSTESEIVSLYAGLRKDGLLALYLWDIVIEVQRSTIQEIGATLHSKTKTQNIKRRKKIEQLNDVDYVLTNTHSSEGESQLYTFEDKEAVIKMITECRSPALRHVSRTHTVALDWLFDRINLGLNDPNQICWHQKPTRWHSNQRKLLTRWMESPSSFVRQYEFLDVFLQPFQRFSFWRSG